MQSSRVLIIDCGASRVLAGRFRRAPDGRLSLMQDGVEWLPRRDRTEEGWLDETGGALAALARRESLAGSCVVGLPAHLTFLRVVALPRVSARRRRQIIAFEMREGVPVPLAELVWSGATVATPGGGREIVLTAARRSTIEALCERLGAAGLYPVAALPAWLALQSGLAYNHPDFAGALAVAVGARSTLLVFDRGAGLCLRSVALGGDAVTERVAENLGLDLASAEFIKRGEPVGTAPPGEAQRAHAAVRMAADEFGRRLGGEIARSLAAIAPGESRGPGRLYLSGGGAQLAGLPARLADHLRLPVVHRDPWQHLDRGGSGAREPGEMTPALLGDLVGVAAARGGPAAANLLPRPLRRRIWLCRHRGALAAAALLALAAMGGAIGRERRAADTARGRAAEVEIAIGRLRQLDRRNRANLDQLERLKGRTAALQRLVEAKRGWVGLLADLQERLVRVGDAWLERLQVGPAAGSERPDGPGAGRFGPKSGRAGPEALPPIRIAVAGCLFDPDNPSGPAGAGAYGRAQALLAQVRASPYVASVENERFDGGQPGVLRFEMTLVLAPGRLL